MRTHQGGNLKIQRFFRDDSHIAFPIPNCDPELRSRKCRFISSDLQISRTLILKQINVGRVLTFTFSVQKLSQIAVCWCIK